MPDNLHQNNTDNNELWLEYLSTLNSYHVSGNHSFKDGQDITGLYELKENIKLCHCNSIGAEDKHSCKNYNYDNKCNQALFAVAINSKDELILNVLRWYNSKGDNYRNNTLLIDSVNDFKTDTKHK